MCTRRFLAARLAATLCLSLLAACGSSQKPAASGVSADAKRYSTIFYDAFDTITQVIAYCDSEEEFNLQMDALHADLLEYHRLYDIYNDYDGVVNVKTINDNAGTAPVQVDDKILGMLELARQMYDTTGGKLNIAMGSVLRIWHDCREAAEKNASEADNTLPTQEELEAAAQHCDINDLIIDEDAKTVYLADPEMSLDVGSVGKGYAVEMVCRAAEARGLTSALVSVGGNLRAIGTKPDGSQWTGGVEDPWNASEVYTNTNSIFGSPINMSDLALVTSGDYQRYFVVDGKRYHHIIDPKTGKEPYAVVQLRKDNADGSIYNLVGFQTHLKWGEQKRVFSMIPALKNAEFVRYGVMHRNTYLNSPKLLDRYYRLRTDGRISFAGQMTGVEGYVESTASGFLAAVAMAAKVQGKEPVAFPKTTAIGALGLYISDGSIENFQPMNINFSIISPLEYRVRKKAEKNLAISQRALEQIDALIGQGF